MVIEDDLLAVETQARSFYQKDLTLHRFGFITIMLCFTAIEVLKVLKGSN